FTSGRKFSTTTSAFFTMRLKAFTASGDFRLSVMLRLLRWRFWKSEPSRGPPSASPALGSGGNSILMTLAPQSASWRTQVGPERTRVRSSTVNRSSAVEAIGLEDLGREDLGRADLRGDGFARKGLVREGDLRDAMVGTLSRCLVLNGPTFPEMPANVHWSASCLRRVDVLRDALPDSLRGRIFCGKPEIHFLENAPGRTRLRSAADILYGAGQPGGGRRISAHMTTPAPIVPTSSQRFWRLLLALLIAGTATLAAAQEQQRPRGPQQAQRTE